MQAVQSGFRRVKSELFEGGAKELAPVIRTMRGITTTAVEREFDQGWAEEIKTRVETGRAVSFHWSVADLAIGPGSKKERLRMNGQHSSWALDKLLQDNTLPGGLAIHLDTYEAKDKDAAVLLFRQFDSRQSARTKEDISGAYQMFHPALRDCNRGIIKLAVEGVNWYRREVDRAPGKSGDDVFDLINEERLHPFLVLMNETITSKCPEMKRAPVLAAAYGTWWSDAKRAAEFWKAAAVQNDESAATDLDTELQRIKDEKEKVSTRDLYAKCAKAWIAYLNESRVTNFKVNTKTKGLPEITAA